MKVDSYTIAKVVGVSQATVSRAFSRPEKVSPATRQKIMEAAESLGYKLDKNASALRKKGTNTILLIYVKREDGHYWTNVKRNYWIFSEAVLALTSYFEDQPYFFEVKQVNSLYAIKEKEIRSHCDGVLIFDFVTPEEAGYIKSWEIPYVICHRAIHLENCNFSATDNEKGGELQGEYLKSRGSEHPVYIMDEEDPFSHPLRQKGFLTVYPDALVINSENPEERTRQLQELIDQNRIDGISFVNDMFLVQTVTQMYKSGTVLQEDFPLIGYDNSTELQVLEEKPATLNIGIENIYTDASRALIELIKTGEGEIRLTHPPELVYPEE